MPQSTDLPASPAREGERIAKLLARAGIASRREIERMIADGRVARHGLPIDTPATVLPSLDGVTVDGSPVAAPEPTRLFVYHKPVGLIVTERDPRGRPTIYDRLPPDLPRVVPVGRLDLATEGLLLLTTDGGFKRQLELPATGVERSYRARAYGQVTQDQLESLSEGVEIEGIRYGSIDANLERRTGANMWVELTLTEGKNREVRRVLEYLGLQVSRLIRTRYGPFVLGDLPPGEVGEVRSQDLVNFRRTLKGGATAPSSIGEPITAEPRAGFRQPPVARPARTRTPPRPEEADRTAKPRGAGAAVKRPASISPHPGAGRGPVATRTNEPPYPAKGRSAAAPRPDHHGAGRGAVTTRANESPYPAKGRSAAAPRTNHPGAGRGAVATRSDGAVEAQRRPTRPARTHRAADQSLQHGQPRRGQQESANPSPTQLDPGLRRGRVESKRPDAPAPPSDTAPRPPRPQRKTGWAKAKPKSGPVRPRKPRA